MSRERQALMFGMSERAVILFVVIVVHGIRKPPELKRSAGTAARRLAVTPSADAGRGPAGRRGRPCR
ncbi:twin-arginine translocase TatA/TatE family subunit [Streptomyces adustus]|uniref:twin-arginine translocase TatA/TatE family subunit n=1 Tax=Streptomyces adustus TaxID=1609272 RepID=UPI0035D5DB2A